MLKLDWAFSDRGLLSVEQSASVHPLQHFRPCRAEEQRARECERQSDVFPVYVRYSLNLKKVRIQIV